jgi:hypothetical protein
LAAEGSVTQHSEARPVGALDPTETHRLFGHDRVARYIQALQRL